MNKMTIPVLEIKGLEKSFGALRVLHSVDLSVEKGKTVCVLGPSGSGKSTLLRCINFLEWPDKGEILLSGEMIGVTVDQRGKRKRNSDRTMARSRTRFGMVFQQFNLWPHLTVLGNVMEAPVYVQGRRREEVKAEATELLVRMGLKDKFDVYPTRLSGGQKQRAAIARALAMHPEILLFDEPTSALDPELVGEVLSVMKDLAQEGQTMIVVTHEIGFAREAGDEIVFMDEGRIVEKGPPEEFLKTPKTQRARQFLSRFE